MPPMTIVDLGRYLQSQGFDVGEHPAFGGVAPVHTQGSHHYKGQGLDINWPGGGAEEARRLEALFQSLSGNPAVAELIYKGRGYFGGVRGQNWGGYGHPSHAHIAATGPVEWGGLGGSMEGFRTGAPVPGFNPGAANVGVPEYNPWAGMEVPNYPATPRPLPPEAVIEFSERRRAATRALQEAMARRQRGVAETETSFQQFLRDLGRQTDKGLDALRDEGAARNLAFQPAFMGRGQRDIRDTQAEALARGAAKKASRLRELEQGVTDARQRRQEERAAINRDQTRYKSRFRDFIGGMS